MPSGTGYIYDWIVDDAGGIIHVCSGAKLVDDDVAFPFEKCSPELQAILQTKSINDPVRCPPPAGVLRVKFEFDILGGEDLAIQVEPN